MADLGFRRIAARAELDGFALARDAKLRRTSDGVLIRVPERAEESSRGVAEDPQVQREPVFERLDGAAPGVPPGPFQHERRGEGLPGSGGVAGRLSPEAGDRAAT